MSNNFPVRSQDLVVEGIYHLGAVMHYSSKGAVYETEFGDDARPAVIKTRRHETGSEPLAAYWSNGIELAQANLLRVYASGHSVVDGVPVSYVVMERAEESLAGVLAERPLSEAETRGMLTDVLAALRYLHGNGYAHSNLKPSNILAVGDLVKISSEHVTPAGHGGTPAEDMWALGSVIVQALTQKPPKIEADSGPYILREASQSFTDIVRHCLDPDPDKRWTVDQVQSRLDSPMAVPVSVPPLDSPGKVEDHDEEEPPRRTPRWVFGALAALVLAVVLLALVRKHTSPPAEQPAAASAPAPISNPLRPADVKPALPNTRGARTGVWSVIAAAYSSREPAEKRRRAMASRWPNFKWGVLQQQAGKTFYLVVIGQNLSEDEAATLRDRAVASGLPRDTYIKKLP
jgi:hypothetical protein